MGTSQRWLVLCTFTAATVFHRVDHVAGLGYYPLPSSTPPPSHYHYSSNQQDSDSNSTQKTIVAIIPVPQNQDDESSQEEESRPHYPYYPPPRSSSSRNSQQQQQQQQPVYIIVSQGGDDQQQQQQSSRTRPSSSSSSGSSAAAKTLIKLIQQAGGGGGSQQGGGNSQHRGSSSPQQSNQGGGSAVKIILPPPTTTTTTPPPPPPYYPHYSAPRHHPHQYPAYHSHYEAPPPPPPPYHHHHYHPTTPPPKILLKPVVAVSPAPSPPHYPRHHHPRHPDPSYSYSYVVHNPQHHDYKSHEESRQGDVVRGQYSFLQPNGIMLRTTYYADAENGFNAVVEKIRPNCKVAIKTIKKSKIETEADLIRIRREIQIMSSVRHPNIIHIYEVFENREKMVLVMEYAAGGELYDYLNERKILQEDEARRIFRQVASAVYYCHKHKICHRDLKLENILLDEKFNAKIADFGLSNVFDEVNLLKTFCGSPLYASPEIVRGTPYKGPEVDCWSLGVLLYTLVYGAMPFDGSNFKRLVKQISHGDYFEPKKPAEASPLIRIMLTVDPKKRADIWKVCSQPWVNQGFDKECLGVADELATQTPVRLDLLLALANCSAINHSQVVIEQPPQQPPAQPPPQLNNVEENAALPDGLPPPPNAVIANHVGERDAPRKKIKLGKVQSKSKSSPMLELIKDVEDELELPQPGEGVNDEEEACDTLSEISEIQTIAEELAGDSTKLSKAPTDHAKKEGKIIKKDKTKTSTAEPAKPPPPTPVAPTVKPQTVPEEAKPKKTDVEVEASRCDAKGSSAPATSVVPGPSAPEPVAPIKKKIVKPKVAAESEKPKVPAESEKPKVATESEKSKVTAESEKPKVTAESEKPTVEAAPTPEVPAPPPPVKEVKDTEKTTPSPVAASPRETTPAPKEKSATPTDKETSDSGEEGGKSKAARLKDRADSVSPTRIERRNSKVISQKTAELIQNLETKVSPSGSTTSAEPPPKPPGIKKIVIPSFKVSDAKSKFESKPPRPLTTSVSRSKAAFEAKLQSQTSVEEKQPPKSAKGDSPPAPETFTKPKPEETPTTTPSTTAPITQGKEERVKPDITPADKVAPQSEKVTETEKVGPPPPPAAAKVNPPKGKIQVAAAPVSTQNSVQNQTPSVATQPPPEAAEVSKTPEVKPVLVDSGKGGPQAAVMIMKGKQTAQSDTRNLTSPPVLVPATSPQAETLPKPPSNEPVQNAPAASPSDPPCAPACPVPTSCIAPPESDTEGDATGKSGATAPPPLGPAAAAKQRLLSKLPPGGQQAPVGASQAPTQNGSHKEQAAKKISSVITKIVNSGSADKGLNTEEGPRKFSTLPRAVKPESEKIVKTEVSFPVSAPMTPLQPSAPASQQPSVQSPPQQQQGQQQQQERIIPIKLVDDVLAATPTPVTSTSTANVPPSASASTTSVASRTSIPISRADSSFKRLDSTGSIFSRQNSSDTDTCSVATAPPKLEPIRKCPREFLIPIKLEESGHTVTPREELTSGGSTAEASQAAGEDEFRMDSRLRSGRFARPKRYSSLLSDSSFDEDPSVSTGASTTGTGARRASTATTTGNTAPTAGHTRSRSQGDEPTTPGGTFKRYRSRRHATAAPDMPLDRSDSFSSAEEDEEDAFQVLTAESLFSNLLDRVRNLTRRINRDDPLMAPNWSTDPATFGLWGASPLREFMTTSSRAPSESRSYTSSANPTSYRREPSVTMGSGGAPGGAWRRSLSRDLSGDSDSGHSLNTTGVQSRSQLSRLGSDLYEAGSVRSLPLSSRRSPSYLSHRSVDTDLDHSSPGSSYTSPRTYTRTMSHSAGDYPVGGTSSAAGISRTLPLRRSLKTFDRNPQNILPEYESTPGVGGLARHSLFDSKYHPHDATSSGSSYLTRLRSASRERPEQTLSRVSRAPLFPSSSGEANGRDGGHDAVSSTSSITASYSATGGSSITSPLSTGVSLDSEHLLSPNSSFSYHTDTGSGVSTPTSSAARLLSVQEKMNNYSQYYQSLTQNPFRRLPMASPSQIHSNSSAFGVGLSELRNSQMSPLLSRPASFHPEHRTVVTTPLKVEAPETLNGSMSDEGSATPCVQSPVSNTVSSVTSPSISPPQMSSPGTTSKAEVSPKSAEEMRASKPPTASSASGIPRWPSVSVRQHRPLSISSFPDGPRANSVSRVMSPPPAQFEKNGVPPPVNGTTEPNNSAAVAALVQKRRDARATSVERITRLLERKSMPREVPPSSSSATEPSKKKGAEENGVPSAVTPLADTSGTGGGDVKPTQTSSKMPKFLQNLEKKWDKLTHSGGSVNTNGKESQDETTPMAVINTSSASQIQPVGTMSSITSNGVAGNIHPTSFSPEPQPQTRGTSEESSSQEDKINESVLLRRALSPEKKVKATNRLAAAGGTVNFMLGKFKRMEQEPQVTSPVVGASKIPTGRPPMGTSTTGINMRLGGRRALPYTGTASDSVLTLTAAAKEIGRTADTSNGDEAGLINSAAVMAQEKRRLQQPRVDVKTDGPSNQEGSPQVEQPLRSPPHPQPTVPPPPTVVLGPPPQIQIQDESSPKSSASSSMLKMDMSSLSPISVSEGERTESDESAGGAQAKSDTGSVAADDDGESVSDRILRKSFYNRFNATGIDRNRRSHSVTPASSRRSLGSSSGTSLRVNGAGGNVNGGAPKSGGGTSPGGPSNLRRSVSPSASTVASVESKESSSDQSSTQNRSPSPYWSGLNKYNPNPLFKELMINENFRTPTDVGKKTEYSRRITSKLSKLLREIESDLNSCHLTKTGSGVSEDGDSSVLLLGQTAGITPHPASHPPKKSTLLTGNRGATPVPNPFVPND